MERLFNRDNWKDIISFVSSIDTGKNDKKAVVAAAILVSETVAVVKATEPVTDSHEVDIVTSAVTDNIMLATFEQMSKEQKILLLNSALQTNEKQIAALEQRHRFAKEIRLIDLRDWIVKAAFTTLVAIGVLSVILFVIAMYRNGVSNGDAQNAVGVISSFITTVGEILKLVLSNDIK